MKIKVFAIFFTIIVLLELIFGSMESYTYLHYFTKPAIVITLILFFIFNADHLNFYIKSFTMMALLFSLWGDVLLMFVSNSAQFFMAGLIAFLLAHVMYILVFLRARNSKRNSVPFIILLLLYATGLFYFIKDGLGEMLIPVLVYMTAILILVITAFMRKGIVLDRGYLLVFIGAIFFMISDSLLAMNKFYTTLAFSNVSIMTTYSIAQFLIVLGILKSYKKRKM